MVPSLDTTARRATRSVLRSLTVGFLAAIAAACATSQPSSAPGSLRRPVIDQIARTAAGHSTESADPKCQAGPPPSAATEPVRVALRLVWDAPIDIDRVSSPTVADLNGDGTQDVVVGGGVSGKRGSVTAVLGTTGAPIWQRRFPDEISTTPLTTHLDGAGTDVVVGGRIADEFALDGTTGGTLWSFRQANSGVEMVNAATGTATATPDVDDDHVDDLVFVQSGGRSNPETEPLGRLQFVSGASGRSIFTFLTPDHAEITSVPTVQRDPLGRPILDLTYGSGGRARPGHLTKIRVPFGPSGTAPVVPRLWEYRSEPEGITSSPIVTTSADGRSEVITTQLSGRALRMVAADGTVCWRSPRLPGSLPTTAAVGRFAGLASPGIVVKTVAAQGVLLWLDGRDGRVAASARIGGASWASPLTADLNGDGYDEVVLSAVTNLPAHHGDLPSKAATTHVLIFDGHTRRVLVDRTLPGASSATPTIADLDLDGHPDILVPHFDHLARLSIVGAPAPSLTVNQYRGPQANGVVPVAR